MVNIFGRLRLPGMRRVKDLILRLPGMRRVKDLIRSVQEKRRKAQLFGELAPMVPPASLRFFGGDRTSLEAFKAEGEEVFRIFKEYGGLRRDEKMLDVGSGDGRNILPLTQFFSDQAEYVGIDVNKAVVDWCRENITPRYQYFKFYHIDVYNEYYNPKGQAKGSEYRFPAQNEQFTLITLGSVFTHMLPADVEHYLAEIRRVLKPKGRCLITYFLLTDESKQLLQAGKIDSRFGTPDFRYEFPGYRTVSQEVPEAVIAYDENWIRDLYDRMGLQIQHVYYGSWCGRERCLSYQDCIVAV